MFFKLFYKKYRLILFSGLIVVGSTAANDRISKKLSFEHFDAAEVHTFTGYMMNSEKLDALERLRPFVEENEMERNKEMLTSMRQIWDKPQISLTF